MKRHVLSLVISSVGWLCACGGDDPGTNPMVPVDPPVQITPVLTSASPTSAYTARTAVFQLSGTGTHFATTTTVDFGDPDITVQSMAVSSGDSLQVTASIAQTAKQGPHDVTVTSGSEVVKLTGGLKVAGALRLTPSVTNAPQAMQGQLINLENSTLINQDQDNPLLSTGSGVPNCTLTGDLAVLPSAPCVAYADTQSFSVAGALVDALAPVGTFKNFYLGAKASNGSVMTYGIDTTDARVPQIVARTPTTLTSGQALTNQGFPNDQSTNLYKITTAAADQVLSIVYGATSGSLMNGNLPFAGVAPASGKFSAGQFIDAVNYGPALNNGALAYLPTAGDYYLSTYLAQQPAANTSSTVTPTVLPATKLNMDDDATPDNTSAPIANVTATPLLQSAAYVTKGGAIDQNGDVDYLLLRAGASGQLVVQVSSQGEVQATAQLFVTGTCSGATISSGVTASASTGAKTFSGPVTMNTDYCVVISNSGDINAAKPYQVVIAIQ